jgi:hypothetical protein
MDTEERFLFHKVLTILFIALQVKHKPFRRIQVLYRGQSDPMLLSSFLIEVIHGLHFDLEPERVIFIA